MENLKKTIVLVFIVIVVIILIIVVLYSQGKGLNNNKENYKKVSPSEIEVLQNDEIEIERVEYNAINSAIRSYLQKLNINNSSYYGMGENGESVSLLTDKEKRQKVIEVLGKGYIQCNNITTDTLDKNIKMIEEQLLFVPLNIKCINKENVKSYAVKGITENLNYEFVSQVCLIVNIDYTNQTFSIEPTNKDYDSISYVEKLESIEKNENNQYSIERINMENIMKDYINVYKRLALARPDLIYNYFDTNYGKKRFGSIDEYKKYIQNNINEIKSIRMSEYLVNNYNDYTEYVCKDQYGNLYIFKETAVMQYTLTLDTYTLENEKFTTTYEQSNDQKKVMMNVDKFFQMLNARDYKTSYEILDSGFKNNYFNTQEVYENYMRSAFPDHYKVEYTGFSNEGNILIQKVKLTSMENNTTMEKNIIMKLEEGTKFVMSFNIQ